MPIPLAGGSPVGFGIKRRCGLRRLFWWAVLTAILVPASGCERKSVPANEDDAEVKLDQRPSSIEPGDRLGADDWTLTITSTTPGEVLTGHPGQAEPARGPHDFGHVVRLAGGRVRVTRLESGHDSFASKEQGEAIAKLVAKMDWKELASTQGAGPAGSRTYVLALKRQDEVFEVTTCGIDCCADCARLLEYVREVSGFPRL